MIENYGKPPPDWPKPFGDSPDTDAVYHTINCPKCGAPPGDCYNIGACKFWFDPDNAVWRGYP